ncbi:MAG: SDR family oxidoreductase [SAR86 cluster bacterium]|jgi:NAD(P)-dependent dehydrogenase (short-subunit alcohol dehydrogenase family)|nr:SDR family oxidoreductase [SAR86 cluster bacterium]
MNISTLFSLEGKTAIVTGGSKGIGAMIAKGFVEAGCKVYISSRSEKECDQTAKKISTEHVKCSPLPGDVSSVSSIKELVDQFSKKETSLDILVNNAGIVWQNSIEDFPEEGWDQVLNTNLKSVFFMTQALLPFLKVPASLEDPSRIINISSIAAIRTSGMKDYSYRVSKAGINQLTRVLAKDLGDFNINVNAIAAGFFSTGLAIAAEPDPVKREMFAKSNPIPREGNGDDMAGISIYMASRAGSYMTGEIVTVDGGRSVSF